MSMLTGWRERAHGRRPVLPPAPAMLGRPEHALYLHDDEDALLDVLLRFVAEGQYHGQRTLVLTSGERLAALGAGLAEHDLADWVTGHDAAAVLERFMVAGSPDRERFHATMRDLLPVAKPGTARVYGEMGTLLAQRGDVADALQLEQLWNELVAEVPVPRLCGYPAALVSPGDPVCQAHGDFRR